MKLSVQSMKKYVKGAIRFGKEKGGYLTFDRCTPSQLELFKTNEFYFNRLQASASVTLEFLTDATEFSLDYRLLLVCSRRDSIDIYVNDVAHKFIILQEIEDKGTLRVSLPDGEKKVTVYFPVETRVGIKNLVLNGSIKRYTKRKENILFIGDSITQGYGVEYASFSYVNVATRLLNANLVNWGLSGYYHAPEYLEKIDGINFDKIVVAFGTNDHKSEHLQEKVVEFHQKLHALYNDTPVYVITPIWRDTESTDHEKLAAARKFISDECAKYPHIIVVDGLTLIPNCKEFTKDLLHPNALGGLYYGTNLAGLLKSKKKH